jgi:hypothetical protein
MDFVKLARPSPIGSPFGQAGPGQSSLFKPGRAARAGPGGGSTKFNLVTIMPWTHT